MRTAILAIAATATTATAAPVLADPPPWAPAHGKRAQDQSALLGNVYRSSPYGYERDYRQPIAYQRDRRYGGYRGRAWRDDDGRWRCRRDDGTVGLLIGGGVGALIGREIDGGRDRTVGTILGAAAGALIGREIDRDDVECR